MQIDLELRKNKKDILDYFRNRNNEILNDLIKEHGKNNYKKLTQKLQPALKNSRNKVISAIINKTKTDKWNKVELLESILMVHHVCNVIMFESRNAIWPYEYMSFSRRNGELWEEFCYVCIEYSVNSDLVIVVPPLFADVRKSLEEEIADYINTLPLQDKQKEELIKYYYNVWLLVDAGDIKLELDAHFNIKDRLFNIDFKSGFSSNEKGNTNRLLVVASIYKNIIGSNYNNFMIVRSPENENNHYLQTLKNSNLWEVFCGKEGYDKIGELSGYNLGKWIEDNVNWETDFNNETVDYLKANDLFKYLSW